MNPGTRRGQEQAASTVAVAEGPNSQQPKGESACSVGDPGSIPGSESCPGEGHSNPLQCSCLENPMDRGAWRATVHGGHEELDTTEQLTLSHFQREQGKNERGRMKEFAWPLKKIHHFSGTVNVP